MKNAARLLEYAELDRVVGLRGYVGREGEFLQSPEWQLSRATGEGGTEKACHVHQSLGLRCLFCLQVASAVEKWKMAIREAQTFSRMHVLLGMLDACIKWDMSAENARCKVCRKKGLFWAQQLLCCRSGFLSGHMGLQGVAVLPHRFVSQFLRKGVFSVLFLPSLCLAEGSFLPIEPPPKFSFKQCCRIAVREGLAQGPSSSSRTRQGFDTCPPTPNTAAMTPCWLPVVSSLKVYGAERRGQRCFRRRLAQG